MRNITYLNEKKTQLVYDYNKYQRSTINSDKTIYYVCTSPTCGVSITLLNDKVVRKSDRQHNHEYITDCEVDIDLALGELKRFIIENSDIDIRDEYNKIYLRLNEKYSKQGQLLSRHWKDWRNIRSSLYYYRDKTKPKKTKTVNPSASISSNEESIDNDYSSIDKISTSRAIRQSEIKKERQSESTFNDKKIDNYIPSSGIKTESPEKDIEQDFLKINYMEPLNEFHITQIQSLISKYYSKKGLLHPNFYLESNFKNAYFNSDDIHKEPFIQVLRARDHWLTITNYNPFFDQHSSLGNWFVYDSLNRPDICLPCIKPVLKRLNNKSSTLIVRTCRLTTQYGYTDGGLFALGYAIAIAENQDPAKIVFNQAAMWHHYNWMIENNKIVQFYHVIIDNHPVYSKYEIDLSDL